MSKPDFESVRADYSRKWKDMVLSPTWTGALEVAARKLIKNSERYQSVEKKTGVPWYLIAALHERESDADFSTYLGNGEPLNRVTRLVPRGRGPFKDWEAGAIDAIKYDGLDKIASWPIERIAYEAEGYNGWGYRNRGVPSAYLWSGSDIYRGGKYIADGVWSSSARDKQAGVMSLLRTMAAEDNSIQIGIVGPPTAPVTMPTPVPVPVTSGREFIDRVVAGMEAKGYRIDKKPGEVNIVYIEGRDRFTGARNDGRPDLWNDVRMVFSYKDGRPVDLGEWTSTTQPGFYFTRNPLNPGGAASIKPGQYTAWKVDLHRGQYEALCQRGELTLTRDFNKDYKREGDKEETGTWEGINQHHGNDAATVGPHSAGCLVGRRIDGHEDFMSIVKSDPRYRADRNYMFTTTVLAQDEVPE